MSTAKRVGQFVCKDDPFRVIREPEHYHWHYNIIQTGKQLRATLRADRFAWPGGYPLFLIADDSQPLCFECVKENLFQSIHSIRSGIRDGWGIIGCEVNWEDPELTCSHCEQHIESAYGGEDEE